MRQYKFFILAAFITSSFAGVTQSSKIVDNGVIFKVRHQKKLVGELLSVNNNINTVVTSFGDTVDMPNHLIKKAYLSNQIFLFNNNRFHYKSGLIWNIGLGMSNFHINFDVGIRKRIFNRLDVGAGLGHHLNSFQFFTLKSDHFYEVLSFPIYLQSKYFINLGPKRFYVKGRVGYANNLRTWNIVDVKDGVLLEGGVGLMLPSKQRIKHYIEFSQYTSRAKGKLTPMNDPDILSDIDFDIWFNRFVFTYGIEFGR